MASFGQGAAAAIARRKRADVTPPPSLVYVNTATGSDSNDGLASGTAKLTLAAAASLLTRGGTVKIIAGSSAPLREIYRYSIGYDITLEATVAGTDWYMYASTKYTAGWGDEGGGVWSVTAPVADVYSIACSTLTDSYGLWARLTANTVTPTAPSAGEYGEDSGTLYVHLPGSVSANSNTIEVSTRDSCIEATSGNATLTLTDGIFRMGNIGTVIANGGKVTATDCSAQYGGPGTGCWATRNGYSVMTLDTCIGEGGYNDGFNHHASTDIASVMTLTDCIGRYNDDEGASPHDATVFNVSGGRYHHNGNGGITAVNHCEIYIDGATADYNNEAGYNAEYGGISATGFSLGVVSGTVDNCTLENNDGPGLYLDTGHSVTQSGNTSGLAAGNSDPDTV